MIFGCNVHNYCCYLKHLEQLTLPSSLQVLEFFHFACTSEDINNLAYALMLKEALKFLIFPVMKELITAMQDMAIAYAHIPMLSRTHGQVVECFVDVRLQLTIEDDSFKF